MDCRQEEVVIKRLLDKLDRSQLHRLDRERDVGMARHDDDRQGDALRLETAQELDAVDVVFGDDQSRLRKGHGAHNMAVVRHFAVNLVRAAPDSPPPERSPLKRGPKPRSTPRPMTLKLRRKMAAWRSDYMQTVLAAKTR